MIHLVSVAKSFPRPALPPNVVLRPSTLSIPSDRRVALMARRRQGKTTVLQLLAQHLRPDAGKVVATRSVSPAINAGPLLHPQLSALENIRFIARAYGLDADLLLLAVDSLCGTDFALDQPLKAQEGSSRRRLEAALILLLPFGCYLFDEIGHFDEELIESSLETIAGRGAGLIFTTSQRRYALQYADSVLLLRDAELCFFPDVKEAVEFLGPMGKNERD